MRRHITLGPILVAALLVAACSANAPTGTKLASHPAAAASQGIATNPTPDAHAVAAAPSGQPTAARPAAPSVPRAVVPGCPGIVANPVGCPVPLPPRPVPPLQNLARINLCPSLLAALPVGSAAICGSGFHPVELVTITVTGRLGTTSWQVVAQSDGTFRTVVPLTVCRLMPLYAVARGNRGSISNTLPLNLLVCRLPQG
jgi:hypothetical protein